MCWSLFILAWLTKLCKWTTEPVLYNADYPDTKEGEGGMLHQNLLYGSLKYNFWHMDSFFNEKYAP